eukprot:1365704-Rhodomonas_salina.2
MMLIEHDTGCDRMRGAPSASACRWLSQVRVSRVLWMCAAKDGGSTSTPVRAVLREGEDPHHAAFHFCSAKNLSGLPPSHTLALPSCCPTPPLSADAVLRCCFVFFSSSVLSVFRRFCLPRLSHSEISKIGTGLAQRAQIAPPEPKSPEEQVRLRAPGRDRLEL